VRADLLASVCRGQPFRARKGTMRLNVRRATAGDVQALVSGDVAKLLQRSGLAEQRLAQRLGVSRARLAATSLRLWKKTFSEKRDELAGQDANAQKRGQVSRALRAKLEKALADGNNQ
jgi:hypothetical protein